MAVHAPLCSQRSGLCRFRRAFLKVRGWAEVRARPIGLDRSTNEIDPPKLPAQDIAPDAQSNSAGHFFLHGKFRICD